MAIDTATRTPESELVTIPSETAREVFTDPAKLEVYLGQIRAIIDAFVMPDLSTVSGRDKVKSFAFRIVRSKTYLDLLAQREYQESSKVPKLISEARKTIETKLDAWRDEVRKPVTEWEAKDKARIAKHQAEIGRIARMGQADGQTAAQIRHTIANLEQIEVTAVCEEFADDYAAAKKRALDALKPVLALRVQVEKDQAELAALRAAEAKRKADEAEAAKKVADEAAAKAAAAKRDAEIKAQIEAAARELEPGPDRVLVVEPAAPGLVAALVQPNPAPSRAALAMTGSRCTSDPTETSMVPQIAAALRPLLFPVEQHDVAIQARNTEMVEDLARMVWRRFVVVRS